MKLLRRLKFVRGQPEDFSTAQKIFHGVGSRIPSAKLREMLANGRVVFLKKKKKKIGAFAFFPLSVAGIFSVFFIRKLVIDPAHRRGGMGSALLSKIKIFTRRKKALGFFLFSLASARYFYRRNRLSNLFGRLFFWLR